MRITISICTVFLCSVSALCGEEPFKSLSFDEACKQAKAAEKIVLIDFYTTWCAPCKMLDKKTWTDGDVQKWLSEKTIPLKIDAEKDVKLAQKYNVHSYPTILLLKPGGSEIDRLVGFREPAAFLSEVKESLTGKDSVARAKADLTEDNEDDPMRRQKYADALAQKGNNEEALTEYLWCFDHGLEHGPGYVGVRLSYLLSAIKQLGSSYPPAIVALKQRRDSAEHQLLDPSGNDTESDTDMRQTAIDYSALNRTLGDAKRTMVTYDKLHKMKAKPESRKVLFKHALDSLLAARRYQDIMEDAGDPIAAIERSIEMYQLTKGFLKDLQEEEGDDPSQILKLEVAKDGAKYYEAAVGAGEDKLADKIANRLLKFSRSKETYKQLIEHALRADRNDAAEKLVGRAAKSLPGDQIA
ncbi:MAG TPA: thioredoxin domain-containing protein, partial [Phycisphaerae bacterium]|nr:thioredoxin domain-containing protein [Phycisphaerae bacterium]